MSEKKDEYARILNYYYRHFNKCPVCHLDLKEDKKSIININCPQCGYIININLAEYINLYRKLFEIKQSKGQILADIYKLIELTENEGERKRRFNELKNRYLEIDQDINKLNNILELQDEKMKQMKAEQFNIFNDLLQIRIQRKHTFQSISQPIEYDNKQQLIQIYKNEGIIKDKRVKQLAGKLKMSESDIRSWIQWFDLVVQYGRKNKSLQELNDKINKLEMEHQKNNENLLVEPFKIKDFKTDIKSVKRIKVKPKKAAPSPPPPSKKKIKIVRKKPAEVPKAAARRKIKVIRGGGGGEGGSGDYTGRTITINPYEYGNMGSEIKLWSQLGNLSQVNVVKI